MNTQVMRRITRRHTLETKFQVIRVVVNYGKVQKHLEKIALSLKVTSAKPPIYDRAYPEKLLKSSPSIPVVFMKPALLLLFVQQDKTTVKKG